jgi:hypothetical protein
MNIPADSLLQRPGPYRGPVSFLELAFGLAAGPIAWAVELNAGYALASWPCFPGDHRMELPLYGYEWSWPALVAILFAATFIALVALWVSWRSFQKSRPMGLAGRAEPLGEHGHLDAGTGRTRFLALWGVVFSGGFALASLATGIAYLTVPRCGG